MNLSKIIIKNYKWNIIQTFYKDIWSNLQLKRIGDFNKNYKIYKKNKDINLNVYFKNKKNTAAVTKNINNKKFTIELYLPNIFQIKNSFIDYSIVGNILNKDKIYNSIKLIQAISHEVTHVFDPLFSNNFYTKHYTKKHKVFLKTFDTNKFKNKLRYSYYNSFLEERAYKAELESAILFLVVQNNKYLEIKNILSQKEHSDFENFLIKEKPERWKNYCIEKENLIKYFILNKKNYYFK